MLAVKQNSHARFLLQQGGARKLLRHVNENILFDMKHKINTSSWLDTPDFEEKPENLEHGVKYRASATSEVLRALNFVKSKIDTSEYGFYDMGCGKGKVLCITGSKYTFKERVGIDYYMPFINTAKENLARCNVKGTKTHYMDMTKFTEFQKKAVIYMYNPADDYILSKVIENIEHFVDHAIIIYNKPIHANLLQHWETLSIKTDADPDHCTSIFEYKRK